MHGETIKEFTCVWTDRDLTVVLLNNGVTFVRTIVRDVQHFKRTTVPLHSRVR